uniref:Uncharacterized protein n=1 Tax=Ignisphaera aggregans TaxID=334771 RepID=A0A7C4D145_9CREN
MKIINISIDLDFELLFYPSFALPLLDVHRDKVRKRWGNCAGLVIEKNNDKIKLYHSRTECLEYAEEILGLWSLPKRIASNVSRRYRDFVERLVEKYEWFGIATSSQDDVEIFSSILLSKNTNFHTNVVRWIRNMLERYGYVSALLNIDMREISEYIGKSYQIYELMYVLRIYMKLRDNILSLNDAYLLKKLLLGIKGVGLKVFNAYMLFVKKNTFYAPIDRNLVNFLKRFELTSNIVVEIPRKDLCKKYICNSCVLKYTCSYYRFQEAFKELSGWIQTIAYVYNKTRCSKALCSTCILKDLCRERKI